jgi:hypothetical protein
MDLEVPPRCPIIPFLLFRDKAITGLNIGAAGTASTVTVGGNAINSF